MPDLYLFHIVFTVVRTAPRVAVSPPWDTHLDTQPENSFMTLLLSHLGASSLGSKSSWLVLSLLVRILTRRRAEPNLGHRGAAANRRCGARASADACRQRASPRVLRHREYCPAGPRALAPYPREEASRAPPPTCGEWLPLRLLRRWARPLAVHRADDRREHCALGGGRERRPSSTMAAAMTSTAPWSAVRWRLTCASLSRTSVSSTARRCTPAAANRSAARRATANCTANRALRSPTASGTSCMRQSSSP